MDERGLNIEDWLRQAAARQTEEHTPDAEKQQAWLQLHAMLNEEPERRSWMWIFDCAVLMLVALVLMLPGMYESVPVRGPVYDGAVNDWGGNAAENKEKSDEWKNENNTKDDLKNKEGVNDGENKMEENDDWKDVKNEEREGDDKNAKKEEEMNDGKDENRRDDWKSGPENRLNTLTLLSTRQLFPMKIPDSLSNVKRQKLSVQSSTVKIKDLSANTFSLNGAFALPADGQYALDLAAEYNYRIWNGFLIRPRIGAAYLIAGKREYSHTAYFPSADTVTNPANPYWVDSLVTNYTVKGILYGMAGLQLAYQYKKLEVFTGIAYHHQLILTGSDSTYTQSREITGTPPVYQRERFNRNRLPGKTNLQLQTGINYMLTRHLQVGASYNMLIQKSTAQKGLDASAPALPAASSATLHVRWLFKKNNGTPNLPGK